ncbi:hypothetical protein ABGB17_18400 [Sphaerisporangium sp. B11E5]|uniref:hypothetical protein n=1 Tax=Sphaerisporangium sp. B11E5 TaxID=3153563 RepID=UPI00325C58DB
MYFFTIESFNIPGASPLKVRQVEATRQVTGGGDLVWLEIVNDEADVPLSVQGTPFTLPLGSATPFAPPPPSRYVGLTVSRTGAPGPVYRSGYLNTLPVPSSPEDTTVAVDVFEARWQLVTAQQINNSISPLLPMTLKGNIKITDASVKIEEGHITLRAEGTKPEALLGLIGFKYAVNLRVVPETEMDFAGSQNVLRFLPFGATIELTSSGPSIPETQVILKLIEGVVAATVTPQVRSSLESAATAAVYAAVGAFTGRTGGVGTIPPSVTLTTERAQVGTFRPNPSDPETFGVHLLLAAGTFGSVINALYPARPGGSGSGCMPAALVRLAALISRQPYQRGKGH